MIRILFFAITIQVAKAALFMPQAPPFNSYNPNPFQSTTAPALPTQVSPNFNGATWNPVKTEIVARQRPPLIFENTVLPPAETVQARNYFDIQQRLLFSAPPKLVYRISTINAGVFSPHKSAHSYLRDFKLLQLAYSAIKHEHRTAPSRPLNILLYGAGVGFVGLGLSIFSRQNDRVTVLDSNREALIAARANIQHDGKDLFLQRINLYPGSLSMLAGGFDLIVLNGGVLPNPSVMQELKGKLATRGYIVHQQGNDFRLEQLQADRQQLITISELQNTL